MNNNESLSFTKLPNIVIIYYKAHCWLVNNIICFFKQKQTHNQNSMS